MDVRYPILNLLGPIKKHNLTMPILKPFFIMKAIKGYNDYLIDENGNIFSTKLNRFIVQSVSNKGYHRVSLNQSKYKRQYQLHRLVAETYIPNPKNKPQVNHIDGNKSNNHVSNLEWVTGSENVLHAVKIGLRDKAHEKARIENQKLVLHTTTGIYYDSLKNACEALNLNYGSIRNYINNPNRKRIELCYV